MVGTGEAGEGGEGGVEQGTSEEGGVGQEMVGNGGGWQGFGGRGRAGEEKWARSTTSEGTQRTVRFEHKTPPVGGPIKARVEARLGCWAGLTRELGENL